MRTRSTHLSSVLMTGGIILFVVVAFLMVNQQASAGSSEHGFLGVYIGEKVKVIYKDGKQTKEMDGANVTVVEDGPADQAGLEDGDVIVTFDGKDVEDSGHLRKLIHKTKPGDEVKVVVLRDGDEMEFKVTMGEPEEPTYWAWGGDDKDIFHIKGNTFPKMIKMYGCGDRPWLGIEMQGLSDQLSEYFKVKDGGVLISSVVEDSPADKAGLKAGDVIIEMGGEKIKDSGDVVDAISDQEAEEEIAIKVLRDGKKKDFKATLAEHPDKGRVKCFGMCDDCDLHELEGLTLPDMKEYLHDIDIDVDVDDLKAEMEKLKEELQELKEELEEGN